MSSLPESLLSLLSARRALPAPGRRDLGNPTWSEAEARVLVARLSPFHDVDRSSPHLILWSELRSALPAAYIDFAFLPDRADRELLESHSRRTGQAAPWFFGAASGASPADFDLVMVSNAFGLELVNLPRLHATAGIPLRASERGRRPGAWPLIILGGSNAAQAGALVDAAGDGLVDGLFFGEGEGAIGPLAAILTKPSAEARRTGAAAAGGGDPASGRTAAADRSHALGEAADLVPGFWPALEPGRRVASRRLKGSPPPLEFWPLFNGPEAGTARLQISAGCPGLCSFCFEGWDRRPYRELPLESLLEAARSIRARTGSDTLEVYSFNFNTHENVVVLLFELNRLFARVNFMSQRLDILAELPGLLEAELAAEKRGFTLGIEGISARMRAYYRKGLSQAELDGLIGALCRRSIRELKLFYIISGGEEAEDLSEFRGFALDLDARRRAEAPGLRLLVSAGYLVRLPGTPLQYAPLALDEAGLSAIARSMESACAEAGIEFRLAADFDEYRADQLLALGGGRLLPWLESIPDTTFIYDGSLSKGAAASLAAFAQAQGILDSAFLSEKDPSWSFPLPFLEPSPGEAGLLYREYRAATAFSDRDPCLGSRCHGCGACPDPADRARIAGHRSLPAAAQDIERITKLAKAKAAFPSLTVSVELPDSLSGLLPETAAARLQRSLFSRLSGAAARLYEVRRIICGPGEAFGLPTGAVGASIFRLKGPRLEGLRELAAAAGLAVLPSEPIFSSALVEVSLQPWFQEAAEIDGRKDAPRAIGSMIGSMAGGAADIRGASGANAGADTRGEHLLRLLRTWLQEAHVSFEETSAGSGVRRFSIAQRDLKKQVSHDAEWSDGRLMIRLAPKADLSALLAPLGPRLSGSVVVRVVRFDLAEGGAGPDLSPPSSSPS